VIVGLAIPSDAEARLRAARLPFHEGLNTTWQRALATSRQRSSSAPI
jgi:hypothetical protein